MAKDARDTEFVFFGEYHDNPISHWLQYEVNDGPMRSMDQD